MYLITKEENAFETIQSELKKVAVRKINLLHFLSCSSNCEVRQREARIISGLIDIYCYFNRKRIFLFFVNLCGEYSLQNVNHHKM